MRGQKRPVLMACRTTTSYCDFFFFLADLKIKTDMKPLLLIKPIIIMYNKKKKNHLFISVTQC